MAYVGRPPSNATLSSADIADGIIVAADLAPDSVGASELADDAVDTAAIADSVTLVTPNLGTPSAVTLTNATFPAGHIVQIANNTYGSGISATISNNTHIRVHDGSGNHYWSCQIDNVGTSNHVFIVTTFVGVFARSGMTSSSDKNSGGGFGLFRGTTEITAPQHTEHYFHNIEASHNLTNMNFANEITHSWLDESPGTGTNIYSLGYVATNTTNMAVHVGSASNYNHFRMTLFEIQR